MPSQSHVLCNGFSIEIVNTLKVQWQKEIQDSLRPDGRIGVLNQCRQKDGTLLTASGTARVVHQSTKAKLKVSFFWPFSGDYWILELGPNYEYAMVGERAGNTFGP